ncbi:MAG: hypothetical protein RL222_1979 [Bacteroidota bacterium]|jgi:hypothetical protein
MKKLLILLALSTLTLKVYCQDNDWRYLDMLGGGIAIWFMEVPNSNEGWFKAQPFLEHLTNNNSTLVLYKFNCDDYTFSKKRVIKYNENGVIYSDATYKEMLEKIQPDTYVGTIFKHICK